MVALNYKLPLYIVNRCQNKKIPIIYFSYLAVFGIPDNKIINTFSKRKLLDIYSYTKNLLDEEIKNYSLKTPILSILPGTIINSNSKYSLFAKVVRISNIQPFRYFFNFVQF